MFIKKWFHSVFQPDKQFTLVMIPNSSHQTKRWHFSDQLIKFALGVFFVLVVLLTFVLMDYIKLTGKNIEERRLQGENFHLKQEVQKMKAELEAVDFSLVRMRNYVKKLQILTGYVPSKHIPINEVDRKVSSFEEYKKKNKKIIFVDANQLKEEVRLKKKEVEKQQLETMFFLDFLLERQALAKATPSLIPVIGRLSSGYGYRVHPKTGTYTLHKGVDIVAEPGSPIRSPAPGTISFSGNRSGYGKVVMIDHGYGIETLFAHNSKLFVRESQLVQRGQIIAQVGSTGQSTGPHLHYEVRKNGKAINPIPFFTQSE